MKKNSIANLSKEFLINYGDHLVRLKQGMIKEKVFEILGNPIRSEECKNPVNEKLVFKIPYGRSLSVSYSILFLDQHLNYVIKLN